MACRMATYPRAPRVAIIAKLIPPLNGGVEQAVAGLVASLGRLDDGNEEYVVVTDPIAPDWIQPYIGPNSRIVVASDPPWRTMARRVVLPAMVVMPCARRLSLAVLGHVKSSQWVVAPYQPCIEALSAQVVHFPYQSFHLTSAPAIFSPWDLQHIYHQEFFDGYEYAVRQHMYPLWCNACSVVDVPTQASKQDLIQHLGVSAEKISIISKAAPTQLASPIAKETCDKIRRDYALPEVFSLFPAQTWPHKNHLRLMDSLALIRDKEGIRLNLVCPGYQNHFWPVLRAKIEEMHLQDQVRFLGFIPSEHVRALYHLAQFTVFPTLFEGAGFPLLEALAESSPLACSDIPVLKEQAGDGALYFDPLSIDDIARTLLILHRDSTMRSELRQRGMERYSHYSWNNTARTHRAMYRTLSNFPLSEEDKLLLRTAFS